MTRIEHAVRKFKGDVVCDSETINEDLMETQFFVNSISDKIIDSNSYLLEPFKHTYVLRELKNVITDRFSLTPDYSRFTGISSDFTKDLERERVEMQKYYKIEE